jgi:hypothetical protein
MVLAGVDKAFRPDHVVIMNSSCGINRVYRLLLVASHLGGTYVRSAPESINNLTFLSRWAKLAGELQEILAECIKLECGVTWLQELVIEFRRCWQGKRKFRRLCG